MASFGFKPNTPSRHALHPQLLQLLFDELEPSLKFGHFAGEGENPPTGVNDAANRLRPPDHPAYHQRADARLQGSPARWGVGGREWGQSGPNCNGHNVWVPPLPSHPHQPTGEPNVPKTLGLT